jgi:hypothetical protein
MLQTFQTEGGPRLHRAQSLCELWAFPATPLALVELKAGRQSPASGISQRFAKVRLVGVLRCLTGSESGEVPSLPEESWWLESLVVHDLRRDQ